MFYYFGRKGRLAKHYPAPEFPLVVEPFAGSGAYTLHWKPKRSLMMEADPQVHDLWHRLCKSTTEELRDAAPPTVGEVTSDPWHLSAMASRGTGLMYSTKVSKWGLRSFEWSRKVALRNHNYARKVDYRLGSYENLPDVEATWFIDPPYQKVKGGYQMGSSTIDYEHLADWCRSRRGQVIVCEQEGADWLPFRPFLTHTSTNNRPTREVWWTNAC